MIPSPESQKGSGSRKPVRRDPEKRRLQNIQAQKKYRDKLKQRLNNLEAAEASPDHEESTIPTTTSSTLSSPSAEILTSQSEPSDESQRQFPLPEILGSEFVMQNDHSSLGMDEFNSRSDLGLLDAAGALTLPSLSGWIQFVDCGCSVPHIEVSHGAHTEYWDTRRPQDRQQRCGTDEPLLLPTFDPYANLLSMQRMCLMNAIMTNSEHIGATKRMLVEDYAVSPFYRPTHGASDDVVKIVKTVQGIFKILKPDLRPIREQIIGRHHPIIDVLPFPTFRKNLIENEATFNRDEFFNDLANGLICWGRSGVPRKDHASGADRASGAPWDSHSWEARPWFLQKYWEALGGESGELVRQSEWWRTLRGEEGNT
ncbi:hypothetical protein NW765_017103 [Fusarium oxysporum]|jgi:hypothetical protein|nr:hypothetical protein FOMA001_g18348 [Fusarium oxysporum f. sp. matthiolae]KAJ4131211.1 hypothetical protein NW765_017103 [Fusarium oxysporum]KAJ4263235.1 hypothetical protein NW764_016185 [Fusarium oxysporum]